MVHSDASNYNYARAAHVLRQLDAEIGSELNYQLLALADIAERKTIVCRCAHENEIPPSNPREFRCAKCRKEVSITAKTFYHKVELFRPRIVIMRCYEMGITITANRAAHLLQVSNDTVNRIYKQLGIVVHTQMTETFIEVPSLYCTPIVSRRSTETPAREHPVAEELAFHNLAEGATNEIASDSRLDKLSLSQDERTIFEILADRTISFDRLLLESSLDTPVLTSTVVMLELKGLLRSLPGNQYARKRPMAAVSLSEADREMENRQKSIAKTFAYFIKDFFQGISRKNIQIYASLHWLSFDRIRWQKDSLRKVCASHPHISYGEILAYVTPAQVKFVPRSHMA